MGELVQFNHKTQPLHKVSNLFHRWPLLLQDDFPSPFHLQKFPQITSPQPHFSCRLVKIPPMQVQLVNNPPKT